MKNLKEVIESLISKRNMYRNLDNDSKDHNFFIINRLLSKKYPLFSNKLNLKNIDKSLAMDMWFLFLGKEIKNGNIDSTFYKWFWSKSVKKDSKENKLSKVDNKYLLNRLNISQTDLNFLLDNYEELVIDEMKYLKKIDKS